MGVAQVTANDLLTSQSLGVSTSLNIRQSDSPRSPFFPSSNDLHGLVVSDITVTLVDHVENCPQVGFLRAGINLDAHRSIDPDFILHEKKEIF